MIANFPLILAIPAEHPAKSVPELVAWDEGRSGQVELCDVVSGLHDRDRTVQAQDRGAGAGAIPYKSSGEIAASP